jgi:Tfp pilus assembly protein PilV
VALNLTAQRPDLKMAAWRHVSTRLAVARNICRVVPSRLSGSRSLQSVWREQSRMIMK